MGEASPEWAYDYPYDDPYATDRCLCCEVTVEDADPETDWHEVDSTGELLCEPCAVDLRQFKRAYVISLFVDSGIPDDLAASLLDTFDEWCQENGVQSSPNGISNAAEQSQRDPREA